MAATEKGLVILASDPIRIAQAFINALCGKSSAVLPAGGKNPQRNEPVTEVPDIRSAQPVVVPPPATISIPNQAAQPPLAPAAAPLEIPAAIARVEEPVVAKPPASSDFVAPMRAESDSIMYELNEDDMGRSYFGITMFILFAIGIGFITTQTDWVDRIGQAIETGDVSPIAEISDDFADEFEVPEEPAPIAAEVIDWSALPSPTSVVNLAGSSRNSDSVNLSIREDAGDAIVDFVRGDATSDLTIVLTETRFSGNRSPLVAGQYVLENNGEISFKAGQDRVRTTISMRSNPVRETDHQVRLTVTKLGEPDLTLATLQLQLEDDDQQAFEEGLPINTVAFAVNQISVQEYDPAAQIDVLRYNPDNTALEVAYDYTDVTASAGQDYFVPDITVGYFAPGQRIARIIIPLGQDAREESDEAFMLELDNSVSAASENLFSQIAVMIRDDDT